ncbi:hypothetical protein ZEAMMB73_Zm00001d026152 [Zea mays]|uniref:Uncharacterized protein n=1 Tax=Zea mays TaxID=4577 RepID=A0A1D6JD27_MAIZE|nr:hypothetical protein ZEAMMB73_Zm00001d026152 [Zea mays]
MESWKFPLTLEQKNSVLTPEVCQGTDSEKKDTAVGILNEMKSVMELSKKTRLDLSASAEPVKPLNKHAARAPEDKRVGKVLSAEKSLVPPTSLGLAGHFVHNTGGGVPLKPDNSDTAAHGLPVKIRKWPGLSKITGFTKRQGGLPQGSYVIGGSPIGWNFLVWPGSKAVYYGLTKAEWLARQSANRNSNMLSQ